MDAAEIFPEPQGGALDCVLRELAGVEAEIRAAEGRKRELLAEVRRLSDEVCDARRRSGAAAEMVYRAAAAEVGFTLSISDRSAEALIARSRELSVEFPAVLESLGAGRISAAHAAAVADAGALVQGAAARRDYTEAALRVAEGETPNRTRRAARVLAAQFAEASFSERYARAAEHRAVWVTPLDDGMAELHAVVDAAAASALHDRLTRGARAQLDAAARAAVALPNASASQNAGASLNASNPSAIGPVRTLAQARADLFVELLLNGDPTSAWQSQGGVSMSGIDARVQVVVPAQMLGGAASPLSAEDLGQSQHPQRGAAGDVPPVGIAELDGYGPIPAARARLLAGLAKTWDRVAVDPETGEVLAVDRYRPSEEQLRFLRARDQHCRFPGCTIVPFRADIDHTRDAVLGGETSITNLAVLCRRHHTMKHHAGMNMVQHANGTIDWTSPRGQRQRERPPSRVRFARVPIEPPFGEAEQAA
ncbi:HNH endonuclease signature motif containing protein [Leucobacter musarum]|uniref:HNH endonuclease signature motif containing protein n=1 Tax=Leucobacter musarum TaxID=1930747 RepID=UPI0006A7E40F|nr:HNH endonuclease signature motif containing protein [Leucobacter musarum]